MATNSSSSASDWDDGNATATLEPSLPETAFVDYDENNTEGVLLLPTSSSLDDAGNNTGAVADWIVSWEFQLFLPVFFVVGSLFVHWIRMKGTLISARRRRGRTKSGVYEMVETSADDDDEVAAEYGDPDDDDEDNDVKHEGQKEPRSTP